MEEGLSKLLRDKYIDNSTEDNELFIVLSKHLIHVLAIKAVKFNISPPYKGTRIYCDCMNFFLTASHPNYESDIEILKAALHKKRIRV